MLLPNFLGEIQTDTNESILDTDYRAVKRTWINLRSLILSVTESEKTSVKQRVQLKTLEIMNRSDVFLCRMDVCLFVIDCRIVRFFCLNFSLSEPCPAQAARRL